MYNIMQKHVTQNPSLYMRTLMRFYGISSRTHYEVLNLRKNCTDKEIKESFIRLSKQYHPDKNKDANAQEHFVRIVEAYNVLGKPSSRASYDRKADYEPFPEYPPYQRAYTYNVRNMRPQEQPRYQNFYQETSSYARQQPEASTSEEATSYGGVGVKRVPTYVLLCLCVGIAVFGTFLQVLVIRRNYLKNKRKIAEKNEYLINELAKVRGAAQGKTNETQSQILLEKIVGSANPVIATASLGHSLATANKQDLSSEPEQPPSILADFGLNEISNFWYTPKQETPLTEILGRLNTFYKHYYHHRR